MVGSESSRVEKSGHGSTAEVEATPLAVNLIITGIFKSDNNWVERTTIDEDEAGHRSGAKFTMDSPRPRAATLLNDIVHNIQ